MSTLRNFLFGLSLSLNAACIENKMPELDPPETISTLVDQSIGNILDMSEADLAPNILDAEALADADSQVLDAGVFTGADSRELDFGVFTDPDSRELDFGVFADPDSQELNDIAVPPEDLEGECQLLASSPFRFEYELLMRSDILLMEFDLESNCSFGLHGLELNILGGDLQLNEVFGYIEIVYTYNFDSVLLQESFSYYAPENQIDLPLLLYGSDQIHSFSIIGAPMPQSVQDFRYFVNEQGQMSFGELELVLADSDIENIVTGGSIPHVNETQSNRFIDVPFVLTTFFPEAEVLSLGNNADFALHLVPELRDHLAGEPSEISLHNLVFEFDTSNITIDSLSVVSLEGGEVFGTVFENQVLFEFEDFELSEDPLVFNLEFQIINSDRETAINFQLIDGQYSLGNGPLMNMNYQDRRFLDAILLHSDF